MKKIFQLIIALILTSTAIESKAQLVNGSIAPDFTFTDIAGNTQHLYALLDSGFTTYINVSTAWSASSWHYHHTGDLDSLYKHYGPQGSNVLRVLLIEAEITNDSIQLYGISNSTTYSGLSQGNFTTGTLFPIIDFDSAMIAGATAFLGSSGYNINSYPAIYMICPDRSVTLVGEASTANLYAAKSSCSVSSSSVDAEMMPTSSLNSSLASCDSVIPTFRIGNLGTSPLTSATITLNLDGTAQKVIHWTGNLPLYGDSLITGVKVGAAPGIHTVTAIVSNPNGSTDPTNANDTATANFTIFRTVGGGLVSQNFDTTGIPATWITTNGGVASTWENANHGYNSPASATLPWYTIPAGDVDMLTIDDMSFVGVVAPGLSFDVSYASFSPTNHDKLEVQASSDCGTTWTTYYSKVGTGLATHVPVTSEYRPASAADWRHESVYLFSLSGEQSVLVRFKGTSDYGNDIYIDNVNVVASLGVNEISNVSSVDIYPNPASDMANINFTLSETSNVTISLENIIGEEILKAELGNVSAHETLFPLNIDGISNGLYFVTVKTSKGAVTKKIVISR